MTEARFEEAQTWAAHWAQHWFAAPDGADRLSADGVSAGWATHVEAYLLLLDVARQTLGLPREPLSLPGRLKARGWDRAVRGVALGLTPRTSKIRTEGGVALVAEIPTPSMLEGVRMVAAALPADRRSVACADPRALLALRSSQLEPEAIALRPWEAATCLRRDAPAYLGALSEILQRPPNMILGDRDVTPQALDRLNGSLRRSLPWLAVEWRAVRRWIERVRPRAVAIASDQHRIGRLVVQAAAEHGIRVTVLQHGLPQTEIGYVPVVADRVAAWSEESAAWFVTRGTDPSTLSVLGNPRFDPLVEPRPRRETALTRERRLLVALSPGDPTTNNGVVSMVLAAVRDDPNVRIVVKLHPGHREWSWVAPLVERTPVAGEVRVAHHENLYELLHWADVTIVHRSTVALESLVAGTPVVAVVGDAPSVADMELRDLDLPTAGTPEHLASVLLDLAAEGRRTEWLEHRGAAIGRAAGPLTGSAAQRIARRLLADADER